ncbi:integral membrane protein [Histoplasma ohiense]|nr:integral membrane protein [Histoplasma ohiense (nom. inval.)]
MDYSQSRSKSINPDGHPFQDERLQLSHIRGPISWLNPTHVISKPFSFVHSREHSPAKIIHLTISQLRHERRVKGDISYEWRSRDNRKGRHSLIVERPTEPGKRVHIVSKWVNSFRATLGGIKRMVVQYPYWDISYLTAISFTIGSIVWVMNSFFVFLPLVQPKSEFAHEILIAGGVSAFVGATIFEVGSIFLVLEAINVHDTGCFGWALEHFISEKGESLLRVYPDPRSCTHHHVNQRNLVGRGGLETPITNNSSGEEGSPRAGMPRSPSFKWLPTLTDLRTHYIHELGFLASSMQLIGATIFWIAGLTSLPGINNHLSENLANGVYRAPQIIGGVGFIISSTLFMLETQKNWYTPALRTLGWHINLWNLIGSFGFTLSGIFLLAYNNSGLQYQACLSTFWGSWAFLVGSVIQWYESLDKYPVEDRGSPVEG